MNCQKRETERKWTKTRVLLARVSRHGNDIFWKNEKKENCSILRQEKFQIKFTPIGYIELKLEPIPCNYAIFATFACTRYFMCKMIESKNLENTKILLTYRANHGHKMHEIWIYGLGDILS